MQSIGAKQRNNPIGCLRVLRRRSGGSSVNARRMCLKHMVSGVVERLADRTFHPGPLLRRGFTARPVSASVLVEPKLLEQNPVAALCVAQQLVVGNDFDVALSTWKRLEVALAVNGLVVVHLHLVAE